MLHDVSAYTTTFFDFYGREDDFPPVNLTGPVDSQQALVQDSMVAGLQQNPGMGFYELSRFIPYVQMHEFEALLFSDPARFASGIGCPKLEQGFNKIRCQFETPEHINNGQQTSPSKRILELMPEYQKTVFGPLAVLEIGLATIRKNCPLFDRWLSDLELLSSTH